MLLDMNRGVGIVADEILVQKNGVLVVVALPRHEGDGGVLTERDLTVRGSGTVGNDLAGLHAIAVGHDGTLVDTGALVGALELHEVVGVLATAVGQDHDALGGGGLYGAALLGKQNGTRIGGGLVLHTGRDVGLVGHHQRHGLLLHVRAHQGTGVIVVFKEGDHRGSDRNDHLRRGVHVIDLLTVDLHDLGAVTGDDLGVQEVALLVKRLIRLGDDIVILDVGRHILDLVGHAAGGTVNLAVGSLEEAVLVDLGVGGKIGDKTDVRTFGRFDRADAAVVRVMHVTDVKAGAVTGKTAGTKGRKTALVRQLGQGVILIHELRKRRGAEELTDRGGHRADVHERLRRHILAVVDRHALLDVLVHARHTDTHLVLEQLTDAAETAVAKVVDIVKATDAMRQRKQVVDRGKDIVLRDVLGRKLTDAKGSGLTNSVKVAGGVVTDLTHHIEAHLAGDTDVGKIKAEDGGGNGVVAEHLDLRPRKIADVDLVDGIIFKRPGIVGVQDMLGLKEDLTGQGADDRAGQHEAGGTGAERELFVEFITADRGKIVSLRVEEHIVDGQLGTLDDGRFTGTELLVDLLQGGLGKRGVLLLRASSALVLLEGSHDHFLVAEAVKDLLIALNAEGTDKDRNGQLSVFIDLHVEDPGGIGLVLQPGAAVRDHRVLIGMVARLINIHLVDDAGGTDDLGNDNTLGTVDHEGTGLGHQGEVPHVDLVLLDLPRLLIGKTDEHLKRRLVGRISLLALLHRILRGGVDREIDKFNREVARIVVDGRDVPQDLHHTLLAEPLKGFLLYLDEVRHFQGLVDLGKAESRGFTELLGLQHRRITPFHRISPRDTPIPRGEK